MRYILKFIEIANGGVGVKKHEATVYGIRRLRQERKSFVVEDANMKL